MLFGFKQIPLPGANEENRQAGDKPAVRVYVATDMSPIEQTKASDELRAEIQKASPRVQEFFKRVMRRASGG